MDPQTLHLQLSLRKYFKDPMGTLIEGTIDQTIPELKRILENHKGLLTAVGDVTAEILVTNEFDPDIIITDGYTKREKLSVWRDYPQFVDLHAQSPAGMITKNAWETIIKAVIEVSKLGSKIHIKIDGEEDLLVLPLVIELPDGSMIVYGQPNQGVVLREVNTESKASALALLEKMKVID